MGIACVQVNIIYDGFFDLYLDLNHRLLVYLVLKYMPCLEIVGPYHILRATLYDKSITTCINSAFNSL